MQSMYKKIQARYKFDETHQNGMGNFKILVLQCIVWYLMWGHHYYLTMYHMSINWQMDHAAKNSILYIIYAKELEIFLAGTITKRY